MNYCKIIICLFLFISLEVLAEVTSNDPPFFLKKTSNLSEHSIYTNNGSINDGFTGTISIKKSDLHELIAVIRSLDKPSDSIWIEIRPFLLALISALIGAYTSLKLFARQERFKLRQQNVIIANKWLLNGYQLFNQFIQIRRKYRPFIINLESGGRILKLPSMKFEEFKFEQNIAELVFFINEKNENKGWELHRIHALFKNCSFIYTQIEDQNARIENISNFVDGNFDSTSREEISWEKIILMMGRDKINSHVLQSELLIKMIDDIIIELKKFIQEVPDLMLEDFGSTQNKKDKNKGFNLLVSFDLKDKTEEFLAPIGVNIDELAKFTGLEKTEINSRLVTGHSQI